MENNKATQETLKFKEAIVYATHGYKAAEGGMVPGNGYVNCYSFNSGEIKVIATRPSRCSPDFSPNLVKILFVIGENIFDAGEYGLYNTLEGKCLVEGEIESVGFQNGFLYFKKGFLGQDGLSRIPLSIPTETGNVSKSYCSLNEGGIVLKDCYKKPEHVTVNGKIYRIENFPQIPAGRIIGPDNMPILQASPIEDAVAFPEDLILQKLQTQK